MEPILGEQHQNKTLKGYLNYKKRAARITLKADYNSSSSKKFSELGWSSISNRPNYDKVMLTYKTLYNLTPEYSSSSLKLVPETHNRNLRLATIGSLSVPRSRTSLFDVSFSASAPK